MAVDLLDLTADLKDLTLSAADPGSVDELLGRALESLADVVPYDLAAVLELKGTILGVRCARGRLADDKVRGHAIDLARFPTVRRAIETRQAAVLKEEDHRDGEGDPYDGVLDFPHGHACMVVPLFSGDRTIGAVTFDHSECRAYPEAVVNVAAIYSQIMALAIVAAEQAEELRRYRARLEEENRYLRSEAAGQGRAVALLERGRSPGMRRVVELVRKVAATEASVLIRGETGTGKELVAQAIHELGPRADRPFVKLNCAALPENLLESELFGHRKGAFSGAVSDRPGRFAIANGGTLFLDEVGDLPAGAQAKLLRVLQEGTFESVGSDRPIKVDVRVIAATHVDLEAAIEDGAFREDLFYRLNLFPIALPPLRERREDIAAIAEAFLDDLAARTGRGPWTLDQESLARLQRQPWPGNVRELLNVLERETILKPQGVLEPELSAPTRLAVDDGWPTLDEVDRRYIRRVLERTEGRIYGDGGAAELLGLKPSTLQSRMQRLGVERKPRNK